jgi:LmbE family N-acetylglucosaminyl deacetylase
MLAVVSPHCDDGVFGCGDLIAAWPGAVVVTVFAGRPPAYPELTPWDAAAGFLPGDDVAAARREEDRAALKELDATPIWLDFCDSQYREPAPMEDIVAALDAVLQRIAPTKVVVPLGLFHNDHGLASDAALAALARFRNVPWLAYEDAIYRTLPGLVAERLDELAGAGLSAVRVPPVTPVASPRKRAAIACYASQLRALCRPGFPGFGDALAPERFWRLAA